MSKKGTSLLTVAVVGVLAAFAGVIVGTQVEPLFHPDDQDDNAFTRMCTYSEQAVLEQAEVVKVANQRLEGLQKEIQDSLVAKRDAIQKDQQAWAEGADDMSSEQRQQQLASLRERGTALQDEAHQLNARLQYTGKVVQERIDDQIAPLLDQAYADHHCQALVDNRIMLKASGGPDLVADVVNALNAAAGTVDFDLLQLPEDDADQASPEAAQPAGSSDNGGPAPAGDAENVAAPAADAPADQ